MTTIQWYYSRTNIYRHGTCNTSPQKWNGHKYWLNKSYRKRERLILEIQTYKITKCSHWSRVEECTLFCSSRTYCQQWWEATYIIMFHTTVFKLDEFNFRLTVSEVYCRYGYIPLHCTPSPGRHGTVVMSFLSCGQLVHDAQYLKWRPSSPASANSSVALWWMSRCVSASQKARWVYSKLHKMYYTVVNKSVKVHILGNQPMLFRTCIAGLPFSFQWARVRAGIYFPALTISFYWFIVCKIWPIQDIMHERILARFWTWDYNY